MTWNPDTEEAEFIGRICAIDASLGGHVADLLRKGTPLYSVRRTLEDAVRIANAVQGKRP